MIAKRNQNDDFSLNYFDRSREHPARDYCIAIDCRRFNIALFTKYTLKIHHRFQH